MKTRFAVAVLVLLGMSFGQVVNMWLPDSVRGGRIGDTVFVPVLVNGHKGLGVLAVDMALSFDSSGLIGTSSWRAGNATPSGWMTVTNPFACSLLVGMAGSDPLVATDTVNGDTLVILKLCLNTTDTTRIRIFRARLNEGQVPCSLDYGGCRVSMEDVQVPDDWPNLEVCPSPAPGRFAVLYEVRHGQSVSLGLYDADGVLAQTLAEVDSRPGRNRVVVSPADLPAGVYFVRLDAGGEHLSRKVVLTE